MKTLLSVMVSALILGSAARAGRADETVVKRITFFTHTNDENKDHDTCVFVNVTTADGQTLIGHAENRDCGPDDGTEYKDDSNHQFNLDIDADGITRAAAKGFRVKVWQETHGGAGHDTWRWNGRVILYFTDGNNLNAPSGNVELKDNGGSTEFSNPN